MTSPRSWYRIDNKATSAEVWVYDEIGEWGVGARDFVRDLNAITEKNITLHINSPGGDVFDGIAIYNALRNHPADIAVRIDGVAASAASFIAQAGTTVTIERTAQMMIHDAHGGFNGLVVGNAADMRDMASKAVELADLLDKASDNIASIYAERAGGDTATWRAEMANDKWYSAEEAVEAGLADEVAGQEPKPDEGSKNQLDNRAEQATWDAVGLQEAMRGAFA